MVSSVSSEESLAGGWQTEVRRVGDIVLHSPKPQSSTVIALLVHLRDIGFDGSPHPIGDGFNIDGHAQLEYVEGATPHPGPWNDDDAWRLGDLLRRVHHATASFVAPHDPVWQPWFARTLPGEHRVIGHGDLGPWNILKRPNERLVLIDWDNAGPVGAPWELAQLVWLNAQLHDDDVAVRSGLPSPEERIRQAAAIVDGYRLAPSERQRFADTSIEIAIRTARDEAVQAAVTPDTTSPDARGFPTLWAVAWRARAAAWMVEHRAQIHAAIAP